MNKNKSEKMNLSLSNYSVGGCKDINLPALEKMEPRLLLTASPTSFIQYEGGLQPNEYSIDYLTEQGDNAVQGQWIAQFSGGSFAQSILDSSTKSYFGEGSYFDVLGNSDYGVIKADSFSKEMLDTWLDGNPFVSVIEPDFIFDLDSTNDPGFDGMWWLENTGQTPGTYSENTGEFGSGSGAAGVPDADIDASSAWELFGGGIPGSSNVVVGVIDSGIDFTHPDLYMNVWINQAEIPSSIYSSIVDVDQDGILSFVDFNDAQNSNNPYLSDYNSNGYIDAGDILKCTYDGSSLTNLLSDWEDRIDADNNGYTDDLFGWDFGSRNNMPFDRTSDGEDGGYYHGTAVAGVLGAAGDNSDGISGVNWNVQIMPLRTGSRLSSIIPAIQYATDQKLGGENLVATNNSYGSYTADSVLFKQAIQRHSDADILFVTSAGNDGHDNDSLPRYPSCYDIDNIIAVGSSDRYDNIVDHNYGANNVDIAAPGYDVLTTVPLYDTGIHGTIYHLMSGTSFATPIVTGIAALAAAYNQDVSAETIKSAIISSADSLDSFAGKNVAGGRVNAYKTLLALGDFDNAPDVAYITPAYSSGATDTIEVIFDQGIDSDSVIPECFDLRSSGADCIYGTADDNVITITSGMLALTQNNKVTITLSSDLVQNEYRLTLNDGVGNSILSEDDEPLNNGDLLCHFFNIFTDGTRGADDRASYLTTADISGVGSFTYSGYLGDSAKYAGRPMDYTRDVDMFRIDAVAGQLIEVSTSSSVSADEDADTLVRIFDSNGDLVAVNDDYDGMYSSLKYSVGTSGSYYVAVTLFDVELNAPPYNPGINSLYAFPSNLKIGGYYNLSMDVSAEPSDINFISGTVWQDYDNDAVLDSTEDAMPGWSIWIDLNRDDVEDANELVAVDVNGNYYCATPDNGIYDVVLKVPDGWDATSPSSGSLSVNVATQSSGNNFGVRLSSPAGIEVTSGNDSSSKAFELDDLSLRQAIYLASQYNISNSVVSFADALHGSDVHLSKNRIEWDADVSISGNASSRTSLIASYPDVALKMSGQYDLVVENVVLDGVSLVAVRGSAVIENVKFTGSYDRYSSGNGGFVIYASPGTEVNIVDCEISECSILDSDNPSETNSSLIYNNNSNVSIYNTEIKNNTSSGFLLYNIWGGDINIDDSCIQGNVAALSILYSDSSGFDQTVEIENSLISDNITAGKIYGGRTLGLIHLEQVVADLENILFYGNTSSASLIACMNDADEDNADDIDVNLTQVTIFKNHSWSDQLVYGELYGHPGYSVNVTIENSTIYDNSLYSFDINGSAAATTVMSRDGRLTLENSIIGNTYDVRTGTLVSHDLGGYGAMDVQNCFFTSMDSWSIIPPAVMEPSNNNQYGTPGNELDPQLGVFQDNGGDLLTLAPLPGSPLIDAGNNSLVPAGLTTDQRGASRTLDGDGDLTATVDCGAVEYNGIFYNPVVSTLVDENDGDYSTGDLSLREAIDLAEAAGGYNVVTFADNLSGTITLGGTALEIGSYVSIEGPGADVITIDANGQSRVFEVSSSTTSSKISGLSITGGDAGTGNGGGIYSEVTLELKGLIITDNSAVNGGGIYLNDPSYSGLLIEDTTISGNTASGNGGGIYAATFLTEIDHSTFSGNTAANGGGLYAYGWNHLYNVTVSGNSASSGGGGIFSAGGTMLVNSTIADNSTTSASAYGAGIHTSSFATQMYNTLVTENYRNSTSEDDVYGTLHSSSTNNLVSDGTGMTGISNGTNDNMVGTSLNPLIAYISDLGDHGSVTQTHRLLYNSPAIDAGDDDMLAPAVISGRDVMSERVAVDYFTGGTDHIDIGADERTAFVVTTLTDESDSDYSEGDLSLREAIDLAGNNEIEIDSIRFDSSLNGTITLESSLGQLEIDTDVSIEGPGADVVTIDADSNSSVIYIDEGVSASVSGLTITGGSATYGGGINIANGSLILSDSVVEDNTASSGGGIMVNSGGSLIMIRTAVDDNSSTFVGGAGVAIGSAAGSADIVGSTISNNTSSGILGHGGGLLNFGSLRLVGSTISGNTASGNGGGIITSSANMYIVSSTITDNHANNDDSGSADGGGINNISSNVTAHNSIIAGNYAGSGTTTADDISGGAFVSASSYNLIGAAGDSGLVDGDNQNIVGSVASPVDPGLAVLADNGGTTMTHALLPGSPAIDAGSNSEATSVDILNDCIGSDRFVIGADGALKIVDIGAYEYSPVAVESSSSSWVNTDLAEQTGKFSIEFDVTVDSTSNDAALGLSSGSASSESSLAAAIRFNASGYLQARDDSTFTSDTSYTYSASTVYHLRIVVDITTETFSVYVSTGGDSETLLAEDYDFMGTSVTEIDNLALGINSSSLEIENLIAYS